MMTLKGYKSYTDQRHGADVWEFQWSDGTTEVTRDAQHAEAILRDHHASSPGVNYNAQSHHL